jgi:hypothetical protein
MIYIILGMHKSGTTLIAEILHKSGIYMGQDFDSGQNYYSGNHYESYLANVINAELLKIPFGHSSLKQMNFEKIIRQQLKSYQQNRSQGICQYISQMNQAYPQWGMKSPWLTFTYDAWAKYLPDHRLILVYRHPWDVFLHYFKKNGWLKKITAWKSIRRWDEYNRKILKIFRQSNTDPNSCLIIRYDQLLHDHSQFKLLEQFAGKPLPDCRKNNAAASSASPPPLANILFRLLFTKKVQALLRELNESAEMNQSRLRAKNE